VVAAVGVSQDEVTRQAGAVATRDPQNWGWVLAALRALSNVPGLDERMIDSFTRDVAVYLTHEAVQQPVDSIVIEAIGDEPVLVIAHSLGTVVAYNALRRVEDTSKCVGLITVGFPLGIGGIFRRLATPVRFPVALPFWFNAFDRADVVSLQPLDDVHFNVEPPVENYGNVRNFTDNRHGIAGYLSDPVVAKHIAEALQLVCLE
jgi:pimeloyl-ACP methyl ester carboxylesterase